MKMKTKRVLVCGSRRWADEQPIRDALTKLAKEAPICVIEGGARGADEIARQWVIYARQHLGLQVEHQLFPANWTRYGKSAGIVRNKQMLAEGQPDLVLAFQKDASAGTESMIRLAQEAKVPVVIWHIRNGRASFPPGWR